MLFVAAFCVNSALLASVEEGFAPSGELRDCWNPGCWDFYTQQVTMRKDQPQLSTLPAEPFGSGSSPESACFVLCQWKTVPELLHVRHHSNRSVLLLDDLQLKEIHQKSHLETGQQFTGSARICLPPWQIKITSLLPSFACSLPEEGMKISSHDKIFQEDIGVWSFGFGSLFAVIRLVGEIFAPAVLVSEGSSVYSR